ncbi:MAG: hypothetical protein A3G33_05555 [Omnitrophica bacterium RIFCSPLOWO2_12_FULL_44_17]|uniref:Uncharacterized protein n=1 Tax=Candidatus Danuiimicrobium aquiferis TaxID=1801832 RepID=A0A1G1L1R4_9BACT|nr:MAG: hypothetical protein A3B72_05475 [Omnitrophica bacterium RIFCSPHIGHO2_02_FULL_45_28]OGW91799.1 MAG: hypothetical protein A3E74_09820 [Omnitrophica bacterium RIFCSPHIGHO2_12_FULL_44_12]OGW99092.1 MAG: hypothetical protein A3G33_05555 [Omnitrophica bacterium RIFCSPLOWO2_12_FULL_44_17]OGX04354.1 MAG: hypothetical protein A3J12_09035 [Omnitrophica bacterium RIFCSPLOWO2_02_FULL_44_11]
MTYQKIFDLKFRKRVPTMELKNRYPNELAKISRIALLELPVSELKILVRKENELKRLLTLKKFLFKNSSA